MKYNEVIDFYDHHYGLVKAKFVCGFPETGQHPLML